jgi:hypothetical protein
LADPDSIFQAGGKENRFYGSLFAEPENGKRQVPSMESIAVHPVEYRFTK